MDITPPQESASFSRSLLATAQHLQVLAYSKMALDLSRVLRLNHSKAHFAQVPLRMETPVSTEKLCCPEQGGACISDTTCSCGALDGSGFGPFSVSCSKQGNEGSLPCRSVCPEKSPAGNLAVQCDIDSRYSCVYGDAIVL